jgi:hypothetical protein
VNNLRIIVDHNPQMVLKELEIIRSQIVAANRDAADRLYLIGQVRKPPELLF